MRSLRHPHHRNRDQGSDGRLRAVIFDYGFTISSEHYFNVPHPQIPDWNALIQKHVFGDKDFALDWMTGRARLDDIAAILHGLTGENCESIGRYLRQGCTSLKENMAVIEFAKDLKRSDVPIALVTANFDVFSDVVVPEHGYDDLFPVIINSSDHGEIDKRKLWPIAFKRLGQGISYRDCLLIEDSDKELDFFKAGGGQAIKYTSEVAFASQISEYSTSLGISTDDNQ
jgi:phosphoglycolate phosphatase-like HAD superfamily hydrolase